MDRKAEILRVVGTDYLSTNQIAIKASLHYDTTLKALRELYGDGRVELQKLSNARYWKKR